jgi:hypothetical protein
MQQSSDICMIMYCLRRYYERVSDEGAENEEAVKTISVTDYEMCGFKGHEHCPLYKYDERRLAYNALIRFREQIKGSPQPWESLAWHNAASMLRESQMNVMVPDNIDDLDAIETEWGLEQQQQQAEKQTEEELEEQEQEQQQEQQQTEEGREDGEEGLTTFQADDDADDDDDDVIKQAGAQLVSSDGSRILRSWEERSTTETRTKAESITKERFEDTKSGKKRRRKEGLDSAATRNKKEVASVNCD